MIIILPAALQIREAKKEISLILMVLGDSDEESVPKTEKINFSNKKINFQNFGTESWSESPQT